MSSVVRKWVTELTWKQQTVLLCAMRGVDGFPKEHPSKPLTRMYRKTILKNADTSSEAIFMSGLLLNKDVVRKFLTHQLDSYPVHWLLHFMHAVEILGYVHPENCTRIFWHGLYIRIVKALHLNPETEHAMRERLVDNQREESS